jgi:hypothetical protein
MLNSITKFVWYSFFICCIIVAGSMLFGYGCSACSSISSKDLAEYPCIPILPNGKTNIHYSRNWNSCEYTCGNKMPHVDVRTCNCSCK